MISDEEYGEDLKLVHTWEKKVLEARNIVNTYETKVSKALTRIKEYERVQMILPKIKKGIIVFFSTSSIMDYSYYTGTVEKILYKNRIVVSKNTFSKEVPLENVYLEKPQHLRFEELWKEEKTDEDSFSQIGREEIKKMVEAAFRKYYDQQ